MTSRPLTLRPWQITALQQHRLRMVVLPLRPQPHPDLPIGGAEFVKMGDDDPGSWCWLNGFDGSIISKFLVPFSPGDTLWVREGWRVGAWRAEHWPRGEGECSADIAVDYMADGFARREWLRGESDEMMIRLMEQSREDASRSSLINQDAAGIFRWEPGESPCRKRSPVTMPRWASRYTLTTGPMAVKRLQEVSEREADAAGALPTYRDGEPIPHDFSGGICMEEFRDQWTADHGTGSWDANPVCLFAQVEEKNDGCS